MLQKETHNLRQDCIVYKYMDNGNEKHKDVGEQEEPQSGVGQTLHLHL